MVPSFLRLAAIFGCFISAEVRSANNAEVETLLTGLHQPCGVAIRPGGEADSYDIYVSETGAGRVIKIRHSARGASADAITGFATTPNVEDAFQISGPRGLEFLDRTRLVVLGGDENLKAFVRLYELSDEQKPLTAEQHEQRIELPADDTPSNDDPACFHSAARTHANDHVADMLVVTALGKEGPSGLWKLPVRAGTLGELDRFPAEERGASTAVAVGSHGYILVADFMNDAESRAARLHFLNPIDGAVTLQLTAELQQVVGLAYSPRTGRLYAADFASRNPDRGGVYRIDDVGQPGKPACAAVRVAEVRRPTALSFGPDNALYVTAFGESDGETSSGALFKITGDL